MGTISGVYDRVPVLYYCDKTRVHMFYFDSNTAVPLQCVALVFWKDFVWLTVPCDPNTIWINARFQIF